MKLLVRPELPTASAGTSQAPSAAVDNSAPFQTHPFSLIYRGLAVQTNRATSLGSLGMRATLLRFLTQICSASPRRIEKPHNFFVSTHEEIFYVIDLYGIYQLRWCLSSYAQRFIVTCATTSTVKPSVSKILPTGTRLDARHPP